MTEEHEVERVIRAIKEVIIAMFSLAFSVMGAMWRMIDFKERQMTLVVLFLSLLVFLVIWLFMPLFLVGLLAGIIFGFFLVSMREVSS